MNGTDVLLLVNTGTPSVPVYTAVGSQSNVTFDESNAEIDLSSKDSRAFSGDYGRYKATMTLDHLYVPDDAGYLALKAAARNGTKILVAKQVEEVTTETANAIVTSVSERDPDQAPSTISVSLTIDGEWTEEES
jgi:hypothetical protein